MPNIGIALAGTSLIGGVVVFLALLAYEKYKESQQTDRRQAYESRGGRPAGVRSGAPPQPSDDCSICRDQLTAPLEILPCGHLFHKQCIKQWFSRRMVCPVCRSRVGDEMAKHYTQRLGL